MRAAAAHLPHPLSLLVPLLPGLALVPLFPWLARRVLDGGALSIACLCAGGALLGAGLLRAGPTHDADAPSRAAAAASLALGGLVVGAGLALASRALVVGGAALLTAGALALRGGRVLVVVPGGALVALAAIHPADIDALVGWPLRALLANGAAQLLALFTSPFTSSAASVAAPGAAAIVASIAAPIAAETVLLVEGRVADVEAACAGTRSLTALALCFAVVTGARAFASARPPRAGVTLLAAGSAVLVLLAFSVVRVAAIAFLAIVADAPQLAEVVHAPLGLFALLAAIGAALLVLERASANDDATQRASAIDWTPAIGLRAAVCTPALDGALAVERAPAIERTPAVDGAHATQRATERDGAPAIGGATALERATGLDGVRAPAIDRVTIERAPPSMAWSACCAIVAAALVVVAVAQVRGPRASSGGASGAGASGAGASGARGSGAGVSGPGLEAARGDDARGDDARLDDARLIAIAQSAGDIPLADDEHALFTQLGAVAWKRALAGGGSVLFVAGPRRAHHAPERCLAAAGLHVDSAVTRVIDGVPVRHLALSAPPTVAMPGRAARDADARFIGTSLFVSRDLVVASALERGLRDAVLGQGPWVFVSLLTPAAHEVSAADIHALVDEARHTLGSIAPNPGVSP